MKITHKIMIGMIALVGVVLIAAPHAQAQASKITNYVVSASVPLANTINIVATQIDAASGTWGSAVTALNFDPMTLNAQFGVYLPNHYFAIDVGTSGGAGTPSVTLDYTEGTNPNSPGHGLGWKSTLTFVKVTGPDNAQVETPIAALGPQQLLKDLVGDTATSAQLAGGFLRMYVGVYTGEVLPETPAAAEVFTNADKPGTYNGTLKVSATVA